MEIKTEHDIYWNYDTNTHKNKNKQWVSVEQLIKVLKNYKTLYDKNYIGFDDFYDDMLEKLKGEQK